MKLEDVRVGMTVRATETFDDRETKNKIGKVVFIDHSSNQPAVLVDFGKGFDGHNGYPCDYYHPTHTCWWVPRFLIEPVTLPKIVITADGKTTTAKRYEGNKVVKTAEAKCHPDDKFDFAIGAKLACDRLLEEKKEPELKPYLQNEPHNRFYGYIGETTNIKDIFGRQLRVGDTVHIIHERMGLNGERVVVKLDNISFVRGIEANCYDTGEIASEWKICRCRRHEEIKDGEIIDGITYIKSPRK